MGKKNSQAAEEEDHSRAGVGRSRVVVGAGSPLWFGGLTLI